MPPILYSSQYNINIPPEKIKATNEYINNLIINSDKYKSQLEKKKIIKKPVINNKQDEI
jgi:hypothetical protein